MSHAAFTIAGHSEQIRRAAATTPGRAFSGFFTAFRISASASSTSPRHDPYRIQVKFLPTSSNRISSRTSTDFNRP